MILKKINFKLRTVRRAITNYERFAVRLRIKYFIFLFYILHSTFYITSCGIYSFTGSSLSHEEKTISISNVVMQTAGGPANMSLSLTEKLKEYYQRNTRLKLVPNNGDLLLEGTIIGYEQTPLAPTAGDKAGLNRLTVRVEVRFTNNKHEEDNIEREFSFFEDFPQEQSLSDVEAAKVPKILDRIVQDIFNNTVANW